MQRNLIRRAAPGRFLGAAAQPGQLWDQEVQGGVHIHHQSVAEILESKQPLNYREQI